MPPRRRIVQPWERPVPGIPGPYLAGVPTIDDDEAQVMAKAEAGVYPDWVEAETRVVRVPAVMFTDVEAAMTYFLRIHGRVYQNLSDARWWAARVPRGKDA